MFCCAGLYIHYALEYGRYLEKIYPGKTKEIKEKGSTFIFLSPIGLFIYSLIHGESIKDDKLIELRTKAILWITCAFVTLLLLFPFMILIMP